MSHRIVYDLIAVRFPAEILRTHIDHHQFYADCFMAFELGGDNNLYIHRGTGEQRARSWDVLALGRDWEVMRQVVTYAASCEGGGMRLSGARHTQAETYIRRYRQAVADATTPETIEAAGIGCAVTLSIATAALPDWRAKDLAALRTFGRARETDGIVSVELSPLRDMAHAAALFAWHHLDERPVYNKMRVHGDGYERTPISKRLPAAAQRALAV
ncbi:hypothetical protein [Kozakia baliensis]|uniref:hypothetical protein n=1 Tax=Kozakia baliensis TaxID=153496 RepID=UPI00087D3458|nr:hypothetical protein [Kozakia baliensis]AOX21530.1 hypothetical protein A0U90_13605 [Kozakia baliensis]